MTVFLTVFLGVATGLAASVLFWWLQARLLRPKIVISPDLRLTANEETGSAAYASCEFQTINRSRFAAADISIKANLWVPGLLSDGSRYIFYMRDLKVPWMDPGTHEEYFVGPGYLLQDGDQKEYCSRLEDLLGRPLGQVNMRELMEACPGSFLTVFVASNHAFSGARSFVRARFTDKDFTVIENQTDRHAVRQSGNQGT
jgi:hypothetical protein